VLDNPSEGLFSTIFFLRTMTQELTNW